MSPPDIRGASPLHERSLPQTAWTTVNAAENIPGVMTPLGASLWLEIVELGLTGAFASFGVLPRSEVRFDERPDKRFGAVFFGRFAGNVDTFRRVSDLTPGGSGADFEEGIFGSVREGVETVSGRRRYPLVAAKAPVVVARLPRDITAQTSELRAWWRRVTSPVGEHRPAIERLREAHARAVRAIELQMEASFVAQGLFDKLGELAEEAGCPDAHLTLMTGYGETEETEMVNDLYRIAHHGGSLEAFLLTHGARCPGENELSARSWREDSEPVERLIAKYRDATELTDPELAHEQRVRDRVASEERVLAGIGRAGRQKAKLLFRMGRRYIPLREEGKGSLAMTMDAGRSAARALGRELEGAGRLGDPEDVFHLTFSELSGTWPPNARELIAERKELRAEYEHYDLPQFWSGDPEPIRIDERAEERADEVVGMMAAAGVVEGRARVVLDASEIDEIEPGEILVCRTTDPSWGSAFFLVSGAVIDIGGPSSHGAIVAREMGLPCVINTQSGTRLLRTGDLVRVDGSAGVVTVIEPAGPREGVTI